jgi:hypothetical protein
MIHGGEIVTALAAVSNFCRQPGFSLTFDAFL